MGIAVSMAVMIAASMKMATVRWRKIMIIIILIIIVLCVAPAS